MKNVTICFTYFRSLTLANLEAALYSVKQQDMTRVNSVVVVDNNTEDTIRSILDVIEATEFRVPVCFSSFKHGDPSHAQSWSTNVTVRRAQTSWVFYTRADYLLDPSMLKKFVAVLETKPSNWDGFIVSHGRHLGNTIAECEATGWRTRGPRILGGIDYDYTEIDSGVWMARRETFDGIGGFDERLSAWGHAQTEFQHRMFEAGVEFHRIPEVLFYHPAHGGAKDIEVAHQQLRDLGGDIRQMWERYPGPKFY